MCAYMNGCGRDGMSHLCVCVCVCVCARARARACLPAYPPAFLPACLPVIIHARQANYYRFLCTRARVALAQQQLVAGKEEWESRWREMVTGQALACSDWHTRLLVRPLLVLASDADGQAPALQGKGVDAVRGVAQEDMACTRLARRYLAPPQWLRGAVTLRRGSGGSEAARVVAALLGASAVV